MEYLILFLKGFMVGVGKIIPGVSGALIAIILDIYEKGLYIISNIFKEFKKNFSFIFFVGSGILFGIFIFSGIIVRLFDLYYLQLMLLFIGLIYGSSINLKKNINFKKFNNFLIFLIVAILPIFLTHLTNLDGGQYNLLILLFMGIIEAISMIIPGLSGTSLLMSFGYYDMIMNAINLIDMNVLFPFLIGIFFGIVFISKLITFLYNKYRNIMNIIIYALTISSIVIMFLNTLENNYSFLEILVGLILLIIGYMVAKIMEK